MRPNNVNRLRAIGRALDRHGVAAPPGEVRVDDLTDDELAAAVDDARRAWIDALAGRLSNGDLRALVLRCAASAARTHAGGPADRDPWPSPRLHSEFMRLVGAQVARMTDDGRRAELDGLLARLAARAAGDPELAAVVSPLLPAGPAGD